MKKHAWLMSAGIFALAMPAHAQDNTQPQPEASPVEAGQVQADAAPSDNYGGQEIIVTAQGRAQALQDVPIAVNVVNAQSLQNSGANDIRQLNQLAPSLLVSSTGSEANGSARIRGIGTVGDNPGLESSVAVFIDGVYRSRSGIGLNELGEIERIEVLRGPQGTLFGRNASAGLINIISKKPSFENEGYAEATYGNYDYIRLGGGVTGPIGDSGLAYRFDGVYVERDGFYRNVTQSGNERRVNDRDRYFVRGQLLYEPNDLLSVRLIGDYSKRDESCCGAVYVSTRETFDPTPGVPGDFATNPTNRIVTILRDLGGVLPSAGDPYNRQIALSPNRTYRNDTEDYGISLQADYDFGGATLTSITGYRYYKSGGAGDFDYGNVDIAYRADDGNASRRFRTFSQELRLQGTAFDDKFDWLVGAYFADENLRLLDNFKFGTQYGAFAACRAIAGSAQQPSPLFAFRQAGAPGCLSPTGRAIVQGLVPGTTPAFGAATPLILAGLDRLSQVNDVGDNRAFYGQKSQNYAFFTHNIINITERLSLTLGARYTNETKKFRADFDNNNTICPQQQAALGPLLANPALAATAGGIITLSCVGNSSSTLNALDLRSKRDEDELTGTAVLSMKATDRLLTYASYSKGYKAGGFNLDRSELGGPNGVFSPRTNADADGLQFEPEKVDAYELGFKWSGRGFTLNGAIFRQDFRNFQLNTFNGSIFVVQNISSCADDLNGGDTDNSRATGICAGKVKPGVRSSGFELEGAMYPHDDIVITAGYTYANTRYRRNLVGSSSGEALDPALFLLAGDQLSNAPKNVITASLTWTPPIGGSGLSGLFYVDTRATSDYNTGSDLFPEKEQDGYVLVNARVGVRGADSRWSLEFWGQNIFNEKYQQVAFNTPFQGAGTVAQVQAFGATGGFASAQQLFSSYLAEPRTYGVTLRTRF
ncbi:TonB-dependent receptor [Allosphingosinicella indica]|uniref:Outer membrane receptor proteins, mostly Fe transport n=1 Tax=Allosphingosinicella indica TaxID=941907 RepID=A0A1X7G8B2_9SPHN|nr:TonB-dependent receptor [Allosphingosinicella indica]SMF65248.1 Outer membrane receptor proteins, mostly Fe transport [Allosphingosinicella indica]